MIFSKRFLSGQLLINILCISLVSLNISLLLLSHNPLFLNGILLEIHLLTKIQQKNTQRNLIKSQTQSSLFDASINPWDMFPCYLAACVYFDIEKYPNSNGGVLWLKHGDYDITNLPFSIQFEWAFCWAVTTILTVEYSDFTPQPQDEVLFTIVCMLVSCIIFLYCIKFIWEIFQELNSKEGKYL